MNDCFSILIGITKALRAGVRESSSQERELRAWYSHIARVQFSTCTLRLLNFE